MDRRPIPGDGGHEVNRHEPGAAVARGEDEESTDNPVERFTGLFVTGSGAGMLAPTAVVPDYFADLQLDRLVDVIVAGRDRHDLQPAFFDRLDDVAAIERRQGVFADLRDERLLAAIRAFCDGLAHGNQQLSRASGTKHRHRSQRLRLNAVSSYVRAVDAVTTALAEADLSSPALQSWWRWLCDYRAEAAFVAIASGANAALDELGQLRYTFSIAGDQIVVSEFVGEDDLGAATTAAFERFTSAEVVETHRFDVRVGAEMEHLQLALLDRVAAIFPEVFDRADRFVEANLTFRHPVIDRVERELQFVLAWLDFVAPLQSAGLAFCLPDMRQERALEASETFDALLAHRLLEEERHLVTNDVALGDGQLLLVVTGPNQGGKTTFGRTVGQLYHLACIGVPVPGTSATLHAPDSILTHFERGDRAGDLESRLEEEVTRMADLLREVSSRSVVILNEMFSSTTSVDARAMSRDVLHDVLDADAVGVCVTFIDELATLDPRVVSLVTGIDADDTTRRTFKVTPGRADGQAHALAMGLKYGLTREQLRDRIKDRT